MGNGFELLKFDDDEDDERDGFRTQIVSGAALGVVYEHVDVPGGVVDIRHDFNEDVELMATEITVKQRFKKQVVV